MKTIKFLAAMVAAFVIGIIVNANNKKKTANVKTVNNKGLII